MTTDITEYMHQRSPQWYNADGTRTAAGIERMAELEAEVRQILRGETTPVV